MANGAPGGPPGQVPPQFMGMPPQAMFAAANGTGPVGGNEMYGHHPMMNPAAFMAAAQQFPLA